MDKNTIIVAQRMVASAEMRLNAQLSLYQAAVLIADEVGMKRAEKAATEALADILKSKFSQAMVVMVFETENKESGVVH